MRWPFRRRKPTPRVQPEVWLTADLIVNGVPHAASPWVLRAPDDTIRFHTCHDVLEIRFRKHVL